MAQKKTGMRKGLTAYGDEGFSLFLRKAFVKAMGYTDEALDRPIVGITNTYSGFNACHRNVGRSESTLNHSKDGPKILSSLSWPRVGGYSGARPKAAESNPALCTPR